MGTKYYQVKQEIDKYLKKNGIVARMEEFIVLVLSSYTALISRVFFVIVECNVLIISC